MALSSYDVYVRRSHRGCSTLVILADVTVDMHCDHIGVGITGRYPNPAFAGEAIVRGNKAQGRIPLGGISGTLAAGRRLVRR